MREVSRPVRRKEIGDVLRGSNAPISYPTNLSDGVAPAARLQNEVGHRRGTFQPFSVAPFPNGTGAFLRIPLSREDRS